MASILGRQKPKLTKKESRRIAESVVKAHQGSSNPVLPPIATGNTSTSTSTSTSRPRSRSTSRKAKNKSLSPIEEEEKESKKTKKTKETKLPPITKTTLNNKSISSNKKPLPAINNTKTGSNGGKRKSSKKSKSRHTQKKR